MPKDNILVGDCLKLMSQWPTGSVDLIFADPPYNIGYNYDEYEDKRDDHDYVDWTERWISACTRLLKPSGSFYVLIGDEYAAEVRLHLKKLERQRELVLRNWIIWHYTFGQNCKVKFNRSHAHLFYCVGSAMAARGGKPKLDQLPFTFNRDAVAVPSARQLIYDDIRANPSGKLPDDTWYLRPQEADGMLKPEDDTWYVSRLCGTFRERAQWHPCQLPEALLERVIKVSSNPGDLVFDPFAGSGSTLRVARRLDRHWLGCELSESYAAQALVRVRQEDDPSKPVVTRNGLRAGAKKRRRASPSGKT